MIVGLICAYQEAARIGRAIASLLEAGVDRVMVVDGAWTNPDGSLFGDGQFLSEDGTGDVAREAGAMVLEPPPLMFDDGGKRHWAIHQCGANPGDHILCLDADERIHGQLDDPPSGHGCVMLRNRPNELETRTPWLDSETLQRIPLLRWLRYSTSLRCEAPGSYFTTGGRIEPYLIPLLAEHWAVGSDERVAQAYRAVRDHRNILPPETWTVLPILEGIEIEHLPADEAKTPAKRFYYGETVAA